MRDPIDAVTRVYEQLDLELTAEALEGMRGFLATESGRAAIEHHYSLEQFGLDPVAERARYSSYTTSYGL